MTALVCAGGCKKNSKLSSSSPAEPQTTTAETEEKNATLDKNTAPTDRKLAPNAPDKEDLPEDRRGLFHNRQQMVLNPLWHRRHSLK